MKSNKPKPKAFRLQKLISRFFRNSEGVTAIEFAIVAAPFFLLVFAILESSILFFASQHLETSIDNVTRKIRTGILNELTTEAQFKEAICDEIIVIIDCNEIQTNVRVVGTYGELDDNAEANDDGDINEGFDQLGPRKIVEVTATYKLPVYTNFASPLRYRDTDFSLVYVKAVTRTEPFLQANNQP